MNTNEIMNQLRKYGLPTMEEMENIKTEADKIEDAFFLMCVGDPNDERVAFSYSSSSDDVKRFLFSMIFLFFDRKADDEMVCAQEEMERHGITDYEGFREYMKAEICLEFFSDLTQAFIETEPKLLEYCEKIQNLDHQHSQDNPSTEEQYLDADENSGEEDLYGHAHLVNEAMASARRAAEALESTKLADLKLPIGKPLHDKINLEARYEVLDNVERALGLDEPTGDLN